MEIKYIYRRWNAQESVKIRAFCHTLRGGLPYRNDGGARRTF